MKIEFNHRGFAVAFFMDRNGEACSLQKSSLAFEEAIWLGVESPKPKILVSGQGWTDIPLPEGTLLSGRMHLTQEQVRELLPYLIRFAETGEIHEHTDLEAYRKQESEP